MDEPVSETTPLQAQTLTVDGVRQEKVNPGGSFKTSFGTVLTCIGCMVGTGNIWRFPRILANNSGEEGCLQFILVWVMFLFIWSIPIILIEYGTGRFTKKATVASFTELIGPRMAWAGGWVAVVDFGISAYYSVIVGWCIYYLFYYMSHPLPVDLVDSEDTFYGFAQDTGWPVLCHFGAILLSGLTVLWGVKSIEAVSSVIVTLFLILILVCFIWSLTLENAIDGIAFIFTPDWSKMSDARMWVDAISQNAFDTGAAAGLFVSYSAYMTARTGIVRYGMLIPIGNNLVSLTCGMLTYATVFSTQSDKNQTEIVELLKTNGPGNTGLTFIWFPLFFSEIPGGRVLCILFFFALFFAGFSSLVANLELFVKIVEDTTTRREEQSIVKRTLATALCGLGVFLLGIGSAVNLSFLENQDFVWGFGLLISGVMFLTMVIWYGVPKFRRKMFNDYSISDWHLYAVWDWLIWVVTPIEVVVLIVWWAVDAISGDSEDEPWYGFSPESFMATILQWVGVLIILITANLVCVKCFGWRRDAGSTPLLIGRDLNFEEDGVERKKTSSEAYPPQYDSLGVKGQDHQYLVADEVETSS